MALEFLGTDWLSAASLGNIAWFIVRLILVIIIMGLGWYFIVIRPRRYPDRISIKDVSAGPLITYMEKGGWRKDAQSETGYYGLMRDKNAMLKHPPRWTSLPNRKGKVGYEFLRYGPGPFDYAVMDYTNIKKNNLPDIIPLADQDWGKHSVKKAAEKKTLGGWWNENKGVIVFTTAMVLSLVLMMSIGGMAQDSISQSYGISAKNAETWDRVTERMDRWEMERCGQILDEPEEIEPPPGF